MDIINELFIIGAIILCILVFVIILIDVTYKYMRCRELWEFAAERLRDDRLRSALENRYAPVAVRDAATKNLAYQVFYREDFEKNENAVCMHLTESSSLAIKKYIFYIEDLIRIGSDPQNDLVIREKQVPGSGICLFRENECIYAKKIEKKGLVYLKRKKHSCLLGDEFVKIRNGDCLIIGKTVIQIHFVHV